MGLYKPAILKAMINAKIEIVRACSLPVSTVCDL